MKFGNTLFTKFMQDVSNAIFQRGSSDSFSALIINYIYRNCVFLSYMLGKFDYLHRSQFACLRCVAASTISSFACTVEGKFIGTRAALFE